MRNFPHLLFAVFLATSAFAQTNLLTVNSGFETNPNSYLGGVGTFTSITGWRVIGTNSGSTPIVGVSTDQPAVTAREGSAVAYLWNGSFETAVAARPAVDAGTRYILRVLSESDTSASVNYTLGIQWYNSTAGYTPLGSSLQTVSVANQSAFQTLLTYVTAPAGATYAAAFAQTGNNVGVLLDRVEFFPQPIPPAGTTPTLPIRTDRTVSYGLPLTVNNTVTYQGFARPNLTYMLLSPPNGATIDASGVISWTPTMAQAGNTYSITTRVVDNNDASLTAQNSFQVSVINPPNVAPVLPSPLRRTVLLGSTLRIANAATDANLPAQVLTYTIVNPPAGATIDSSGTISFTPTALGAPILTTLVTDNGTPALSATNRMVVEVVAPAPGNQANLLTNNPGFESTPNGFSFYHGAYTIPGWDGYNNLYNGHYLTNGSVVGGETTEGVHAFHFDWEGTLTTAAANRPAASAGNRYQLSFDLRTLIGNFPEDLLGTFAYLEFFNATGTRIKSVWGPDWRPQSQANGVAPWETIVVSGLAPTGTASVGVRVNAPSGIYYSSDYDRSLNRQIELDNFRLQSVPETLDRLAARRLPRLVEPGKNITLRIQTTATATRTLMTRLVDSTGAVRVQTSQPISAGRGLQTFDVTIPSNLPNGSYTWELGLLPTGSTWSQALAPLRQTGVIVDQTVTSSTVNTTDFRADHPNITYMGRIEELANGSRRWHWFASEVRLRFSGTSLSLLGAVSDNGFGGYDPSVLQLVVDGNVANPLTVSLPQSPEDFVLPLVSGLTDGIHTATLFKREESNLRVRFDAFRLDAGRGLLRTEPLSGKRLEIYGDSVTNGGEASPNFFGYAPSLGRELDVDVRIIAKGGTGVAASFSGQATLLDYWNNLSHPNVFNASLGVKANLTTWIPNLVLIAIGHNDQFNGGGPIFRSRYAEFYTALRAAYPTTPLLCGNTTISNPIAHFQNAIAPLLATDPLVSMAFQLNPSDQLLYGHPDREGHRVMTYGDANRFSYSDVVEEKAGWGIDRPLSGYEKWVLRNFSTTQIAQGVYGPNLDAGGSGISNFLRYALNIAPGSFTSPTTAGLDAQGRLTFTFLRADAEATYIVEASNDLVNWQVVSTNPGAVGETITLTDSVSALARRFMRLRVVANSL